MFGLNCLLTNNSAKLIAKAMRNLSDIKLSENPDAKITVKDLYKELKDADVDIDLQSAAFIYGTEFFKDMQDYKNFETEEDLREYASKIAPTPKDVKEALMKAGYEKQLKNGKKILDWTKLMGKSEEEIKSEIRDKGLGNEDAIFKALENDWKQIVSNALIKAVSSEAARIKQIKASIADLQNKINHIDEYLNKPPKEQKLESAEIESLKKVREDLKEQLNERVKQETAAEKEYQKQLDKEQAQIDKDARKINRIANPPVINRTQRTALEKLAELYSMGLNTQFGDTYKKAIRQSIGMSEARQKAVEQIDEIAKMSRAIGQFGLSADNDLTQNLQKKVNAIIADARYADMNGLNKILHGLSTAFDFSTLRLLNNLGNLTENYISGKGQQKVDEMTYGKVPDFVSKAAKAKREEIIKNGAADFGTEHNMFLGERNSVDHVREILESKASTDKGKKLVNSAFNYATGIWGLNATDSMFKLQSTWQHFMDGMEKLYMSKTGTSQKEADKWMNEQINGENYEQAKKKSEDVINSLQAQGYKIEMSQSQKDLLTADIIKAQIVNNTLFSKEQVESVWKAAYKSAGENMGHIANNPISMMLGAAKMKIHHALKDAEKKGDQNKMTVLMVTDILLNKMMYRFVGGGSNWIVLQLDKTGAGVVKAAAMKFNYDKEHKDVRHLSQLSNSDIQETLQGIHKTADTYMRGKSYGIANLAVLGLAAATFNYLTDDQKKKYVHFVENNQYINRYVNKLMPVYLAAYQAHLMDTYKNPKTDKKEYTKSLLLQNVLGQKTGNERNLYTISQDVYKTMNNPKATPKQKEEAMGKLGRELGQYFNLDILPDKAIKDMVDIYEQANTPPNRQRDYPRGFWHGYLTNTLLASPYEKNVKK